MMKQLTCGEIANACQGVFYGEEKAKEQVVAGIVLDSRKIEKDWVFVATVGEKVDGHSFISQVYEAGAACVVCEKPPKQPCGAYILVPSSFQALKDIAAYYRSKLDATVVGITGSVGKTSTKEMIASVLAVKYKVQKTAGNFNNEVGLPLTVFTVGEEHDIAVLEMGISDFGEMERLAKIARPEIMVITNIGQCHLENLGTRDGILKAKTEVFGEMDATGKVVLNADDDKLSTIREVNGNTPYFFSRKEGTVVGDKPVSIYATEICNQGLKGSTCRIHIGKESIPVTIPIPGGHMVWNALAAATVGHLLGMTLAEIGQGIAEVQPVNGRSNVIETEAYTLIDDCYNANPGSMGSALDLLSYANQRKVAVMGDMFELGEKEALLHEETGAYAVNKGIDVIICVGTLAQFMAKGAREALAKAGGVSAVYAYPDKKTFLEHRQDILQQKDAILLKASHGMHFEELLQVLMKD